MVTQGALLRQEVRPKILYGIVFARRLIFRGTDPFASFIGDRDKLHEGFAERALIPCLFEQHRKRLAYDLPLAFQIARVSLWLRSLPFLAQFARLGGPCFERTALGVKRPIAK